MGMREYGLAEIGRQMRPLAERLMIVGDWAMARAGARPGDMAVLAADTPLRPGLIVAARVAGRVTLRRLARVREGLALRPEGPEGAPAMLTGQSEILGVVVAIRPGRRAAA